MLCYLTNPFLILLHCPSELQAGSLGLRYTLFAVINHHGTISGGHCEYLSSACISLNTTSLLDVALSKRGDRWFCCDDSYVTECQEHNIVVSGRDMNMGSEVCHVVLLLSRQRMHMFYFMNKLNSKRSTRQIVKTNQMRMKVKVTICHQ